MVGPSRILRLYYLFKDPALLDLTAALKRGAVLREAGVLGAKPGIFLCKVPGIVCGLS